MKKTSKEPEITTYKPINSTEMYIEVKFNDKGYSETYRGVLLLVGDKYD